MIWCPVWLNSDGLPMPARYVIDKQGIIRAAHVNADYTIRSEPPETLRQLQRLAD